MIDEIKSLLLNDTWELIPPTADMNILGCKWVLRIKLHADGSLDKLKAQLVAKRFSQEECVDFIKTFSPVIRTSTIRIVLTVTTSKNWPITQLDVKNAFLNDDLQEEVFMTQPLGFEESKFPTHVCRLKKSLYGLKQALRAWYDNFSGFLLEVWLHLQPRRPFTICLSPLSYYIGPSPIC